MTSGHEGYGAENNLWAQYGKAYNEVVKSNATLLPYQRNVCNIDALALHDALNTAEDPRLHAL